MTTLMATHPNEQDESDLLRNAVHDVEAFAELGFPTTRLEDWKYTNVAPIANGAFQAARAEASANLEAQLRQSPFFDLGCSRLVFVNGFFSAGLSSLNDFPKNVGVSGLAAALKSGAARLEQHLARYADFGQRALQARPFRLGARQAKAQAARLRKQPRQDAALCQPGMERFRQVANHPLE